MAEDPKIVPDPAPWEPTDVDVTPDGPPWSPVDVQVSPDGPPWDPTDVPLYPDLPPADPFDVPTYVDGPPWAPHDVPLTVDPLPWEPTDVPTPPDGPPWAPVDVVTPPDPVPWTPVDVPTPPDAAPWAPVDVPVVLDGPPWSPVDVQVSPDEPGPLSEVIPVRDHRTPPPYEPVQHVSSQELVDRLRKYDQKLANFLDHVGSFVPFVSAAGKGAFDPLVLADWLRNYKDAVGFNGMAKFIEQQTALYAMNPVVARFFDPSYFVKISIPGMTGMFNTTVDVGFDTYTEIARARDKVLVTQVGLEPPVGARDNVFDPTHTYASVQDFTVDEMVDARTQDPPAPSTYLTDANPDTPGIGRFDASRYFEFRDHHGASRIRGTTKGRLSAGTNVGDTKLAKSAATHGIIRIPVPGDGQPRPGGTVSYDGAVLSDSVIPPVDDDDVRLPLCFTDLRKDPASDSYRHVYFQPMNLVINQAFSPTWSDTQAFGRVDPSVGYVGTSRTWSVSFEQHAFAPEDLRIMYEKMTWLISLVYPSYREDALMASGPVCRMRIGDVASTTQGGLPGIIRNLSFDFAECLWELKRGMKVPRSFGVQLEYQVLHDGPIGLLNGMFGVVHLPNGPRTNLAGDGPVAPSQESTDPNNSDTVSIARGRWAKFGEPTRKG